jgi:hypothetical protein
MSDDDDKPKPLTVVSITEPELLEPTRRAHNRLWHKGKSGNPGGLGALYQRTRAIAREASPEMMDCLVDLAKHAQDERVRSFCIVAVLDRAGIKPYEHDPNKDPDSNKTQLAEIVDRWTPEQRALARQLFTPPEDKS